MEGIRHLRGTSRANDEQGPNQLVMSLVAKRHQAASPKTVA